MIDEFVSAVGSLLHFVGSGLLLLGVLAGLWVASSWVLRAAGLLERRRSDEPSGPASRDRES
jgi:hypothetical protein